MTSKRPFMYVHFIIIYLFVISWMCPYELGSLYCELVVQLEISKKSRRNYATIKVKFAQKHGQWS